MFKLTYSGVLIILNFLFFLTTSEVIALNWYQETTINNDRSGLIKITYWDAKLKIKESEIYQSLPFTEDKIRSFYSSDNNSIENIKINKNNSETTYVNVTIAFKDLLKINTAEGFLKIKPTWYISADSTVFLYKFDKNEEFKNLSSCIFTFELPTIEILRFSGIKTKDNSFSVKVDAESFSTGTTVFAVFKNSDDISASDGKNKDENINLKMKKKIRILIKNAAFFPLNYRLY
ncbi:MAG: hypothetical protein IPM96_08025 [Ignavibacteria bacterium]|nr:hypothetical protein [Ignavibacteria bacterium]